MRILFAFIALGMFSSVAHAQLRGVPSVVFPSGPAAFHQIVVPSMTTSNRLRNFIINVRTSCLAARQPGIPGTIGSLITQNPDPTRRGQTYIPIISMRATVEAPEGRQIVSVQFEADVIVGGGNQPIPGPPPVRASVRFVSPNARAEASGNIVRVEIPLASVTSPVTSTGEIDLSRAPRVTDVEFSMIGFDDENAAVLARFVSQPGPLEVRTQIMQPLGAYSAEIGAVFWGTAEDCNTNRN